MDERCETDIHQFNLPMILRWVDRISMRHGIEGRSPFLDNRIVSMGITSSFDQKINEYGGKKQIRDLLNKLGDKSIAYRRKAVGFGHQEQLNFDMVQFDELVDHVSTNLNHIFDVKMIKELKSANQHKYWFLFLYLLWSKQR